MNGLEELNNIKKGIGLEVYNQRKNEFESIERKLKFLQLLKEKNVDIRSIESLVHNKKNIDFTIKNLLWYYNEHLHNIPLTIEEMTLLVEWLKEK